MGDLPNSLEYDGGLFTYAIVDSLDKNDGIINMSYIKAYLDSRLYELYEDLTGNGQDAISISSGGDFAVAGEGD